MSKKSLLYIVIIVFVLTSGFFLASNYKSSIEMKSRGENIVPGVKDVEDIKQPQIEFRKEMQINEECNNADAANPYFCENSGSCCNAENYCQTLGGYYDGTTCYDNQDEYCSTTGQGDVYVSGQGCMTSTTDAYCSATGQGDKYVPGRGCMTSTTDVYCSATNQGDKYVPGYGCMTSTTDAYCLATKGTHYSGGGCRNYQNECVALEGAGSKYKGTDDQKYSASKCDSLADQCLRDGKVLYGGVCKTHQEMCEIKKGKWKNGTCISNNNGGDGVSGKTSNKDNNKEDNPKTDDVIGTDATLSNIILSSGRLMFTPGVIDYRVEVSSNVESITIEPVTTDPDAKFVVNGDTKLKPGENPFTIVVTAEDGKATLTYNVIIVRTDRILSSNSKASLIEVANHEINFDKDQTDYEVDLTIDEDELDIKVTAEDNLSITEVLGNEGLENGDIVTVKVTAEDGSYTVYAIKVNKEEPFNIKDYIPYIIAGVAGLLLIIVGAAILRGRKSNDSEEEEEFDSKKDKIKDKSKDDVKDDFKMKSKD